MSSIILQLPARTLTDADFSRCSCAYFLRGKADAIEMQGTAPLADLVSLIRGGHEVVVLWPAADVTLLRLAVPPLTATKLRAALPNLVEDKLLCEVANCVVVATPVSDGLRTLAVVQRATLTQLIHNLRELGARSIHVIPEQLCLAWQAGRVSVAVSESTTGIGLTLRFSEHEGMGLLLSANDELLRTLRALIPRGAITLFVPSAALSHYQNLCASDAQIEVIAARPNHWQISNTSPDLATGLGAAAQAHWNWQPWRWPLVIASLLLLINAVALNFDWWRMNHEAGTLRASMKQIYLAAYPKETVILDPLLQMRQKIAAAKHDTGMTATDDFGSLAAEFAQAWANVHPAENSAIISLVYHEHSLLVQLKSALPATAMQAALSAHNISLEVAPDASSTWQIRSKK